MHGCTAAWTASQRTNRAALRGAFFDGNTYEDLAAAHGRAARHDEKLDPPCDDQAEGLPWSNERHVDHNGLPDDELARRRASAGRARRGAERAAALTTRGARPRLSRALVADWEERLAPWAGEIDEVAPPPQVWDAHCRRPARARAGVGLWQNLALLARAGARHRRAGGGLPRGCSSISARSRQQPPLVATHRRRRPSPLSSPPSIRTRHHRRRAGRLQRRRNARSRTVADPGRRQAAAARPAARRSDRDASPSRPRWCRTRTSNAVLAVSLEPPGGSPTGQPTGPVIATGKLTNL